MSVRVRLLIAVGLLGLVAAPALVMSAGVGQGCSGSWKSPQHHTCKFISEDKLSIFANALETSVGTIRATTVIDGIERTLAWCSFGEGKRTNVPAVEPTPEAVRIVVEVTPAPTYLPTIKATVTPPGAPGQAVKDPVPGGCSARAVTPPGLEIRCMVNGTGRGLYGCNAYSDQ